MKKFPLLLAALLFIFNIGFIIKNHLLQKDFEAIEMVSSANANTKKTTEFQKLRLETNYLSSLKIDGEALKLPDSVLQRYSNAIFFRASSNNCSMCVTESLKSINKNIINLKSFPVVILAKYPDLESAQSVLKTKLPVVLVNDISADHYQGSEKPYFFRLSKSVIAKDTFFPEFDMPELIDGYLRSITQKSI